MATPAATTVMCPGVAGEAGAAPFATAADAAELAADAEAVTLEVRELKEAEIEDGNGLAASTSLVYSSMSLLPTLLQKSWTGVGMALNQAGKSSESC